MRFLAQIRVQAIVVALVPVLVLALMLAYTDTTRDATNGSLLLANHTRDVVSANDALFNAYMRKNPTQIRKAAAALLAVADTTPDEAHAARAFVDAVRNRASPLTVSLARRDVDKTQRIIAIAALSKSSDLLSQFSTVMYFALASGIVLFLALAVAFAARVALRAQLLRYNVTELLRGHDPGPLGGNDELNEAEHEYRTVLEMLQQEHSNASVLQRALLPQNLPSIPGVRIDASYMPSASGTEIGGDWYDVFAMNEARLGISVGDVAGHGLLAASAMAQIRQAVRMAARLCDRPGEVLQAVNRAAYDEGGPLVTLFYGELSLTSGVLRYASAGHPMPITVQSTGVVEQLNGGGLIMGADRHVEYNQYSTVLDAGSAIVLFTDGLVESGRKVGYDYDAGVRRLVEVVNRQYYSAASNIAQAIQRDALGGQPPLDDTAVLFIGVTDIGYARANTSKMWTIDAREKSAARRAKRAFLWHLGEFAPDGADLSACELIFGELLGNVARHTPGIAEVTIEITANMALLHIDDEGPPIVHAIAKPEEFAEGGRGLLVVESLARNLRIARMRAGNRVTVELPITLTGRDTGPRVPRWAARRTAEAPS